MIPHIEDFYSQQQADDFFEFIKAQPFVRPPNPWNVLTDAINPPWPFVEKFSEKRSNSLESGFLGQVSVRGEPECFAVPDVPPGYPAAVGSRARSEKPRIAALLLQRGIRPKIRY